jgi:hypothetical protein
MSTFLNWLIRGHSKPEPLRPPARVALYATPPAPVVADPVLSPLPLLNWSHPFKDKRDPLQQLTHMANATAGFYPLGRNGMWHGGVHFDAGTAGVLDQSSVHCLADGEVVAYRFDTRSPNTPFLCNAVQVQNPFSRNFVLVRHRLQAPKIQDEPQQPPSLVFYSLYMHLEDWAVYRDDEAVPRPAFWPPNPIYTVHADTNESNPQNRKERGLAVHSWYNLSPVLDVLPPGTKFSIKTTDVAPGNYFRLLEGTPGPRSLLDDQGRLRGYVAAQFLNAPEPNGIQRVTVRTGMLLVRATPEPHGEIIGRLPDLAQLRVSGEGAYRKLEHINQHVYFPSVRPSPHPVQLDAIVVLDEPVPIKAGDLIGHIGGYQDCYAEQPENKLHLEVFSAGKVRDFIEASRAWAKRLPAKEKTWLKLAAGTPVVIHNELFGTRAHPANHQPHVPSAADLLIPKSMLDALPAEKKMVVKSPHQGAVRRWYRLEGLLHDAEDNLIDGWVCDEVGVTPWVSPWDWDGYEYLYTGNYPQHFTASSMRVQKRFKEEELERFGRLADIGDRDPIITRLFNIIDRNRDGQITADEIQAAMRLPAKAQAISKMIVNMATDWHYETQHWDDLDALLGHTTSTPNVNWIAEKSRIKELSWWPEVATKVGLPWSGRVTHFHPVGLMTTFMRSVDCISLKDSLMLALRVSGGFEGRGDLDYHALADDFDLQGTSFGLIQWNFGQGTLGPLLHKMLRIDRSAFLNCFPDGTDAESLESALTDQDLAAQLRWAREILVRNREGWKTSFQALGSIPKFQNIQLEEAAVFHSNVKRCITEMRKLAKHLIERVDVLTYVALYDLCVQQGGLAKGETLIKIASIISADPPKSQKDLLLICVQERAKTAPSKWAADCTSRRMGIINREPYAANINGIAAQRQNPNFKLLDTLENKHVCDL